VLYFLAISAWLGGVVRAGRHASPAVRELALPAVGGIVAWAVIAVTDNAFDYYAQFTQYIGFCCAGTLAAAAMARREGFEHTIE
jgi:hypothetical protein